jgi:hypothetical protein
VIVIGCGPGRSGTLTLSRILNRCHDFECSHASRPLLPWRFSEEVYREKLGQLTAGGNRGDIHSGYLPYLSRFIHDVPDVRIVCTRRSAFEVARSFEAWIDTSTVPNRNHWYEHNGVGWVSDPMYDPTYPSYDITNRFQAIVAYVNEYDATIDRLALLHPERIMVVRTAELGEESCQHAIFDFVGIPPGDRVYTPGVWLKRGRYRSPKRVGTGVTVCIPWRASPSRLAPFRRVMDFWRQTGWPIITADSDTEIFSASQARNNAVRLAETDTVVISDADAIPPMDNVLTAVADPVGVAYPHTTWRLIPADWVDKPISEFPKAPVVLEHKDSFCGVIVTTTTEYWRLGGQPEEFVGWGYEDTAFHLVVLTLSTFRRMPGITFSVEHNHPDGSADTPGWSRDFSRNQALFERYRNSRNQELFERYRDAEGRKWLMRELIKIREEPRR